VLRVIARDERTWRRLFERDYGHLYRVRVSDIDAPTENVPNHPWMNGISYRWQIPVARSLFHLADEGAWLPEPFSRMRTAGKDARWLYIAHARAAPTDEAPRLEGIQMALAFGSDYGNDVEGNPLYRGDTDSSGRRHGYGVCFWPSTGAWHEALWNRGVARLSVIRRCGWHGCVSVDGDGWMTTFLANDDEATKRWDSGRLDQPLGLFLSATVSSLDIGNVPVRRVSSYGATLTDRNKIARVRIDCLGRLSEIMLDPCDERSDIGDPGRNGRCLMRYPNGDRVAFDWIDGIISVVEFVFSPQCPCSTLAGRRLTAPRWHVGKVDIGVGGSDYYFWPQDATEDDERAFWRYVQSGSIGWCQKVCDAAKTHYEAIAPRHVDDSDDNNNSSSDDNDDEPPRCVPG
jgi:hypothetical protein